MKYSDCAEPQLEADAYYRVLNYLTVPSLWRKVMDPKVLKWVDGDMSRVNGDPVWRVTPES